MVSVFHIGSYWVTLYNLCKFLKKKLFLFVFPIQNLAFKRKPNEKSVWVFLT